MSSVLGSVASKLRMRNAPFEARPEVLPISSLPFSTNVLSGVMAIIDGLVVFVAGLIIYLVYIGWSNKSASVYVSGCAVTALLTVAVFSVSGLYELNTVENRAIRYRKIVVGCGWAFVAIIVLAFALKISEGFSRVWLFSWFITSPLLIAAARGFSDSQLRRLAISGRLSRNIVIVGATGLATRFIKSVEDRKEPWIRVLGIFEDRENRGLSDTCQYPILGNLDNLLDWARNHPIDDIVIALPWVAEDRALSIIGKLEILPVRAHLCPDMIGFNFVHHGYSDLCGMPLLNIFQKPMSDWSYVAKNIEDRVLAALLLVLVSPLMGLIAVCIKLDSPGPVFFRQKRYGFNHQVIDVIKFRTLRIEQQDDDAKRVVTRNDRRVTRVGAFLRRTSIDELPQLLNVLKGNMSIVGPRPHVLGGNAAGTLYEELVAKYPVRHKVKPGITGWAQVNGWRGAADTKDKIRQRVEYDLYYIENWSLTFDLIIILRTPWVLLKGNNAY